MEREGEREELTCVVMIYLMVLYLIDSLSAVHCIACLLWRRDGEGGVAVRMSMKWKDIKY